MSIDRGEAAPAAVLAVTDQGKQNRHSSILSIYLHHQNGCTFEAIRLA